MTPYDDRPNGCCDGRDKYTNKCAMELVYRMLEGNNTKIDRATMRKGHLMKMYTYQPSNSVPDVALVCFVESSKLNSYEPGSDGR